VLDCLLLNTREKYIIAWLQSANMIPCSNKIYVLTMHKIYIFKRRLGTNMQSKSAVPAKHPSLEEWRWWLYTKDFIKVYLILPYKTGSNSKLLIQKIKTMHCWPHLIS
jgi:hypothetical protein